MAAEETEPKNLLDKFCIEVRIELISFIGGFRNVSGDNLLTYFWDIIYCILSDNHGPLTSALAFIRVICDPAGGMTVLAT